MKKCMNIIAVFDQSHEKLLVCKRRKEPYKGLLNFVGGKAKPQEDGFSAAYRELEEETGGHMMALVEEYEKEGAFLEE